MEWWLAFLIMMGIMFVLFAMGVPVAFAFLIVNIIGGYLFWGGEPGIRQLVLSMRGSLHSFTLLSLVLFILMGVILFETGMALKSIDALDKWMGRMPGRLGLLAVLSGVLIGTLSGNSMASGAILGSALTPEMEKRGYKKPMSLGPILGSGGIALLIPPSTIAVLVAALSETSVAAVLIGGIIPGLLMALLYGTYIVMRCWVQPSIAPPYEVSSVPVQEKILLFLKYVLPMAFVVFLVTGIIFLGVATPSEAAATGTMGSFILAICYGKMGLGLLKKIFSETMKITIMMLLIVAGGIAFGQILGFSGATEGLVKILTELPLPPVAIIIILQIALILFGMFAGTMSMLMVVIPLFMPVIKAFGMSPVWFCILLILNVEMGATSPPFGMNLFVMKGVAPKDTKMSDIYLAALPFLYCDAVILTLLIAFPSVVLWLPGLMR